MPVTPITRAIALTLPHGATLHHRTLLTSSRRTPVRCRVWGRCVTWKTRPDDFRLPVKAGLKTHFYITPLNASDWSLTDPSLPDPLPPTVA